METKWKQDVLGHTRSMVYKKHLKIPHKVVPNFKKNIYMIVAYLLLNFLLILAMLFLKKALY